MARLVPVQLCGAKITPETGLNRFELAFRQYIRLVGILKTFCVVHEKTGASCNGASSETQYPPEPLSEHAGGRACPLFCPRVLSVRHRTPRDSAPVVCDRYFPGVCA